jgi:hypothetical protein
VLSLYSFILNLNIFKPNHVAVCIGTKWLLNYLYADSVCCLPARMENSRQSLQVWTCPRITRAHLLPSVYQFASRIWAVDMWLNERIRNFIEDLQSSACLWDVHCADYKNRSKKVMRLSFLQKSTKSALSKLRKKSRFSKVSSRGSIKK